MSLKQFKDLISTNSRDTDQTVREGVKGGKATAKGIARASYQVETITMLYPPSKYKGASAPFTFDALLESMKRFNKPAGKRKAYGTRKAVYKGNIFVFKWFGKPGSSWRGRRYVNEQSRNHIADVLKIMEQPRTPADKDKKQLGGHVEASAYLQKLRKAVDIGIISEAKAEELKKGFTEGGVRNAMSTEEGKAAVERDEGFVNIKVSQDAFGVKFDVVKRVNEKGTDFTINEEVMMPVDADLNQAQFKEYEEQQMNALDAELMTLAGRPPGNLKLVEKGMSPSLEKMYQEIIAAKLLGKVAPKYKVDHTLRQAATSKTVTKRLKVPKTTKKATSKVAKQKVHSTLRNEMGQFASPTRLRALINKKLPRVMEGNMGLPGLRNQSGKFANSVRVLNTVYNKNTQVPTIQYTYDKDPYQVFEMGAGDRRWATPERDPRVVIDDSIREIAREMMITRFNTQRV